jgi:nucleotide-binding universal stress UspA family protein
MLSTIIAAIDGSEAARRATEYAGDLASRYGARLILIHVVTREPLPGELRDLALDAAAPPPGLAEAPEDSLILEEDAGVRLAVGERILAECSDLARQHGAQQVETLLLEGDPATVLIARSQAEEAELVVLGAKGTGSLKGLLVGSVSQKVCQLAPCACLTVR